jgi:uncharacterized integral membrane protein
VDIPETLIPIVVPLGAFALAAFIVGAVMLANHRARELRHQTIRLALEKGQPIPKELLEPSSPARRGSDLSRGIKLISVGIGLSAFLYLWHHRTWPVGLILIALGIGNLVSHRLAPPPPPPTGPAA